MATVSTYLNFMGNCSEAFAFYKGVFGTEYSTPAMRMRDVPLPPGQPPLPADEQDAVMHVALPIIDGHVLMGTDMLRSMGHELRLGNNITISLNLDSSDEAMGLYAALSEGGSEGIEPAAQSWDAMWGVCLDRFGIRWMFNAPLEPAAR
jgi:PhnB protein